MRIGQLVSINDKHMPHIQTGIIVRKQREPESHWMWYEVLCNDGQHHILPNILLSPQLRQIRTSNESNKSATKAHNYLQQGTKYTQNKLHYIHNGKQQLN